MTSESSNPILRCTNACWRTVAGRTVKLSTATRWASSARGLTRRVGRFLIHGALGSEMILSVGGREEIALWSSVHQGNGLAAEPAIPLPVIKALD